MAGQASGNMDMYQICTPFVSNVWGAYRLLRRVLPMMRKAANAVRGCNKSVPMCGCMNKHE